MPPISNANAGSSSAASSSAMPLSSTVPSNSAVISPKITTGGSGPILSQILLAHSIAQRKQASGTSTGAAPAFRHVDTDSAMRNMATTTVLSAIPAAFSQQEVKTTTAGKLMQILVDDLNKASVAELYAKVAGALRSGSTASSALNNLMKAVAQCPKPRQRQICNDVLENALLNLDPGRLTELVQSMQAGKIKPSPGNTAFALQVQSVYYKVAMKALGGVSHAGQKGMASTRNPDGVPRVPTECMVHWHSAIWDVKKWPNLDDKKKELLDKVSAGWVDAWMGHDLTCSETIRYFKSMEAQCSAHGLPELAALAQYFVDVQLPVMHPFEQWKDLLDKSPVFVKNEEQKAVVDKLFADGKKVQDDIYRKWVDARDKFEDLRAFFTERKEPRMVDGIESLRETEGLVTPLPLWTGLQERLAQEWAAQDDQEKLPGHSLKIHDELIASKIDENQALADSMVDYFRAAKTACAAAGLQDLATLAESLAAQCASTHKAYTSKMLLPRMNDSVYSRVFETNFCGKLLASPLPEEEKKSMREFGRAWIDIINTASERYGDVKLQDVLYSFELRDKKIPRTWMRRVPAFKKCLAAPLVARKAEFLRFLESDKKNGYDAAAMALIGYLSLALSKHGLHDVIPWKTEADKIYNSSIGNVRARLKEPLRRKTDEMGITLPHHVAVYKGKRSRLDIGILPITEMKMDTRTPSPVSYAHLTHGIATGGVSGSANLMLFMADHFRRNGYDIDFKHVLMASIMQLNSGHSMHDALWAADMLSRGKHEGVNNFV